MLRRLRGNVLLVELLIALLFFSLAAGVTLRVFVVAHDKSERAAALDDASFLAEYWAERLYGTDAAALEAEWSRSGDGYALEGSGFTLFAELASERSPAGVLYTAALRAERGGEVLFEFPACWYVKEAP